jgi:predicted metal-dependent phosphoesterase TrpH
MYIVDLHSHSNVSDGILKPEELISYAKEKKVNMIALTDHDDISGLDEARNKAHALGIDFINGVEISVTWRSRTIHMLGLNFDSNNDNLIKGLKSIREGRVERAKKIAYGLAMVGIPNAYEGAKSFASHQVIGRVHFAHFLVSQGYSKNIKSVFNKFMTKGKPGYVDHDWASMEEATSWIKDAGGMSVIAHPGRYDMGSKLYPQFFEEFKSMGGAGIEVISGSQSMNQVDYFAAYSEKHELYASVGSDFHGHGVSHRDLGPLHELPKNTVPIWENF